MHSSMGEFGGDLKNDTVTIIGATLDLQEKVVSQVNAFFHEDMHHMLTTARL